MYRCRKPRWGLNLPTSRVMPADSRETNHREGTLEVTVSKLDRVGRPVTGRSLEISTLFRGSDENSIRGSTVTWSSGV